MFVQKIYFIVIVLFIVSSCSNYRVVKKDMVETLNFSTQGDISSTSIKSNGKKYKIILKFPNNSSMPNIWEGPLEIDINQKKCTLPISLITNTIWFKDSSYLALQTYSGANNYLEIVNIVSCEIENKILLYANNIKIDKNQIIIHKEISPFPKEDKIHLLNGKIIISE